MTYKAFVSSTYEDLANHRARVIATLRESGFFVDPMEDWTASSDEPKVFSRDRLKDCDLCIALIALRRGHVPEGEDRSITQLELEAAEEAQVDVLVFLLDEDSPWPHKYDELATDPEVRKWRAHWLEKKGVKTFGLDPASLDVGPALNRWLKERRSKTSGERLIVLDPVLSGLRGGLSAATATDALGQLREVIVARLSKLGADTDQPPMHALRALAKAGTIDEAAFEHLEIALSSTSDVLYGEPVSESTVAQAIEAAAVAFNSLNTKNPASARFVVKTAKSGQYLFTYVDDTKTILESQLYSSQAGCINGIQSVRRVLSGKGGKIEETSAKDGRTFFRVIGGNAEVLAISRMFTGREDLKRTISLVKRDAPGAPVVES